MGAPGPHRRLDRAPARRLRRRHPLLQARARARPGRAAARARPSCPAPRPTSPICAPRTTPWWPRPSRPSARRRRRPATRTRETDDGGDGEGTARRRRRRRQAASGAAAGAAAGAGRGRKPKALEGTFDHGEEGYGLWLDPAVQDDPTYAEHWAGHRPVTVTIEPDRIVISRAGEDAGSDEDED